MAKAKPRSAVRPTPPRNPLLSEINKPCFHINAFVYDDGSEIATRGRSYKSLSGSFHDAHQFHLKQGGLIDNIRNAFAANRKKVVRYFHQDFPEAVRAMTLCSLSSPCGMTLCPCCNLALAVKNACWLYPLFNTEDDTRHALTFTAVIEDVPALQFRKQVEAGESLGFNSALEKNWKAKCALVRKWAGDARIAMFPDVRWYADQNVFSVHYHGMIHTDDASALDALKKPLGLGSYVDTMKDHWRYVLYGHKFPIIRLKDKQRMVEEMKHPSFMLDIDNAERLMFLWRFQQSKAIYNGFGKELSGRLRCVRDVTVPLTWRQMNQSSPQSYMEQ